jgi:hypothetical protein
MKAQPLKIECMSTSQRLNDDRRLLPSIMDMFLDEEKWVQFSVYSSLQSPWDNENVRSSLWVLLTLLTDYIIPNDTIVSWHERLLSDQIPRREN